MARYDLDFCDRYLDELLDKMGSDYFPLPIKLNRFITTTLDFIRENTIVLEATQEISDDIKPLLVEKNFNLVQDSIYPYLWTCIEPDDYLRLVSLVPLFLDTKTNRLEQRAKKVDIQKEGQKFSYERDPFRKSNHDYPSVFRHSNVFKVNVGDASVVYSKALIAYIKKPTFGDINDLTERIVDLPDMSIEKILLKTANALRFSTGDSDAVANFQFADSFGKRNK